MGTNVSVADTAEAAAPTATTTEETEQADPAATVPLPVPLSVHDYSCPICLELLLRPVKLSCGHRFCRGCWVRVLQSRDGRAAANTTGAVSCPFRCEVRPVVPEVDQALASVLESHFEEQYTEHASAYALPDEERKATEVNAWAAAGCVLDMPEESATMVEVVSALRAQQLLRVMLMTLALSVAGFGCLMSLLLLCIMATREFSVQLPVLVVLLGMAAGLALLDAVIACYMIEHQRAHRNISRSSLLRALCSIVWPPAVLDGESVAV